MYCSKCGHELEIDVRFCYLCGAELKLPELDIHDNYEENASPDLGRLAHSNHTFRKATAIILLLLLVFALIRLLSPQKLSDDKIIKLLADAEDLLFEVETAALCSETDNTVQIGEAVYYLLPTTFSNRELLSEYYSQLWDDKAVKTIVGYPCYVMGKYAYPLGQLGGPTNWDNAKVVNIERYNWDTLLVDINIDGMDCQYMLAWNDNKWKVKEAPILNIYPEKPSNDIVTIIWKNGTFIGSTHNNNPDGYGVFTRTLTIEAVAFEQKMVGYFTVLEDTLKFDGTVTVTRAGQTSPVIIFTGVNKDNMVFYGTFYFSSLYFPRNTRLEGTIDFNNYFLGKFISGNYIKENYSDTIEYATTVFGI